MEKETVLDDYAFLVSETDEKGIIRFANNDFCEVAEYTLEELIGQPHNMVRHRDMPKAAFKSLWETVQKGEIGLVLLKMQRKVADITGYLLQFIHLKPVKGPRVIYLVEENPLVLKSKKLKNFIKN